jgi:homoserine dehydrogenase
MNAVVVKGDAVGPTLYYGAGAGAEPTGSAVVADVIDVVRALTSDPENRVPHLAFQPASIADIPVLSAEQFKTAYYLRLHAEDKPGVLAEVTKILANHQISIEAIIQKESLDDETAIPIIMLTQLTLEKEMNAAIAEIEALTTVSGKVNRIRLETLK